MAFDPPRAAVIATHNRPVELRRCVAAIAPQVGQLFIVDNASDPPLGHTEEDLADLLRLADPRECVITVHRDEEQPPNLSRLWNLGLDYFNSLYRSLLPMLGKQVCWDVAVLNDDAVPPPGWFDAVAGAMRHNDADAACSDPWGALPEGVKMIHRSGPPSIATRLAGWAFVLRGEWEGARIDDSMRWMFSDDDISYRAKLAGGLVHVGGFPVPNLYADQSTRGVLAEQGGRDRAAFVAKHGVQPW